MRSRRHLGFYQENSFPLPTTGLGAYVVNGDGSALITARPTVAVNGAQLPAWEYGADGTLLPPAGVSPAGTVIPDTASATAPQGSESVSGAVSWLTAPLPVSITSTLPASVAGIVGQVPVWAWLGLGLLLLRGSGRKGRR